MREVLLQICCRCSYRQQSMQFLIVVHAAVRSTQGQEAEVEVAGIPGRMFTPITLDPRFARG
jgi:hypothetical protein